MKSTFYHRLLSTEGNNELVINISRLPLAHWTIQQSQEIFEADGAFLAVLLRTHLPAPTLHAMRAALDELSLAAPAPKPA